MKKELNYLASKGGKKLGVKNCTQLPKNKKSTPGQLTIVQPQIIYFMRLLALCPAGLISCILM
jgi:hypothetical protein